jgi:hypothetical protein
MVLGKDYRKTVGDALRPVSVEFHGECHCIKYADVENRENVRVSWDVRRVSSP